MKHKILLYGALAFALFFIVSNPPGAADTARGILDGLTQIGAGLGEFASSLASGGGR
jgi:hypothetical protein